MSPVNELRYEIFSCISGIFRDKPEASRALVFVKTRELTVALKRYLSENRDIKPFGFKVERLTGSNTVDDKKGEKLFVNVNSSFCHTVHSLQERQRPTKRRFWMTFEVVTSIFLLRRTSLRKA